MNEHQMKYLLFMSKLYNKMGMKLIPLGSYNNWRTLESGKELPLGKIPSNEDWRNTNFSIGFITTHIEQGKNVGFLLGDTDLVVDVDPRNGGLEGLALLEEDLGYALSEICPTVVTGSNGYHFYMKKSDTIKVVETCDRYGKGVEFKTFGRQVVIPGSLHPGEVNKSDDPYRGRQYQWDDLSTEYSDVPECPEELLAVIERAEASTETTSGLMSCADVEEILSQIPAEDFNTNDKWFEMMGAVHFATDGEAIEEFIDWSTTDPMYANDASNIRYRWDSLDTDKASSTTHRTLLFHAEQYNINIKSVEAKLDFDIVDGDGGELDIILDSEAAAAQLASLLNSVDPYELACDLTPDYSSEDLEEAILACLRTDTITRLKCLKVIQRTTGLTKVDLKQVMKEVEERSIKDLGEILAGYVLEKRFNKGRHLVYNIDSMFWHYNGKFWEPIREEWLGGQVVAIWQKIRDKVGISVQTTTITAQCMQLLKLTRSVKDDIFGFLKPPRPVINCANTEIIIKPDGRLKFREHAYNSYLTYCLDVEYDELAECPEWDKAIDGIFANGKDTKGLVRHFEEFMGYTIQPNKNIASWWMMKGFGSNGKSMLLEIMTGLMGPNAVLSTGIHDLDTRRNNHALSDLPGKLMILDDDLDTHTILPDGLLKKVSERKLLQANPKGQKGYGFISCATPVLLTNYFPKARDVSNGTRRRANVIPFDRQFEEHESDRSLAHRIMTNELSGVLNAALNGLRRLRVRGCFSKPEDCLIAEQTWLDEANAVTAFMRECTDISAIPGVYVTVKELYDAFTLWHKDQGVSTKIVGKRNFVENLNALGHTVSIGAGHQRRIKKIVLKSFMAQDDFDDDIGEDELD